MNDRIILRNNIVGIAPTLYEAGKIKIGRKGQVRKGQNGDWQMPEKLDHFLITSNLRGTDNNFLPDPVVDKLPKDPDGKLRRIPVTLLYDEIDLNIQTRYACYVGRTLFCAGDGENANQQVYQDRVLTGNKVVPCVCQRADFAYKGKDKCKITGRLQVILRGAERLGGVYVFRTTGFNSVRNLTSSMALFKRISGGPLAGIPFDLVVAPRQAVDPEGKAQTIYVVSLEFSGDVQALQDRSKTILLENAKHGLNIARIEDEARRLLSAQPAPFSEDLDDDDDAGEFFPHQSVDVAPGPVITHVEEDLKPLPMTDVGQMPQELLPTEKPVEKVVEKAKRGKAPAKAVDPEPLPEPVQSIPEMEVTEVMNGPEPESDDPFKGF